MHARQEGEQELPAGGPPGTDPGALVTTPRTSVGGGLWRRALGLLRGRRGAEPIEVQLYTKAVCPLCDEAKAELAQVRSRTPWRLTVIAIDGDAGLEAQHGRSVPVVSIAGRPAFKGRLTAREFERKLARRAAEATAC